MCVIALIVGGPFDGNKEAKRAMENQRNELEVSGQ